MNTNKYDIIIIGRGFKAMITAYAAVKQNQKVLIISKKGNFFGTMGEFEWNGEKFDLGYQFFDGLNKKTKKILLEFIGKNNLVDLGYGAGSYTNGKVEKNHALPYWPFKGKLFVSFATLGLILGLFKFFFISKKNKHKNLEHLYKELPINIRKILCKASIRNFNLEASKLSVLASDFTPFAEFRQTLYSEKISFFLKKNSKFFSRMLAVKRKTLNLDCISLYPYKKNINHAAKLMYKKLNDLGVNFIEGDDIIFSNENDKIKVVNNKNIYESNFIYYLDSLDNLVSLLNIKNLESAIHHVSQIIFIFSHNKIYSDLQYVHGNDLSLDVNRASNISTYSKFLPDGSAVLIAEVPCKVNSDIWNNTDKYVKKIWNDLQKMQMANPSENFKDFKYFKLKKTFPIPLAHFETNLKSVNKYLISNFKNKFRIPGIKVIGRHDFIECICEDDFLSLK